MTGSCGIIEIFCLSCLRCVDPVDDPLTKISPSIPLLIRNNAEIKLLFPAPVLPTFISYKHQKYLDRTHLRCSKSEKCVSSFPIPTFSPGRIVKLIDFKTIGPSV